MSIVIGSLAEESFPWPLAIEKTVITIITSKPMLNAKFEILFRNTLLSTPYSNRNFYELPLIFYNLTVDIAIYVDTEGDFEAT